MNAAMAIAAQEWRGSVRNRWLVGSVVLMLASAVALALVGEAPGGRTGVGGGGMLIVSLATLGIYFVPLIGLLLGHDAVIAEAERGTLALTLSCPLSRDAFLIGKAASHAGVLLLATVSGVGAAAGVVALTGGFGSGPGPGALIGLAASTFVLGLVFLLIGYAISARVRERATAVGLAVAVWLGFVILYDLAVIGVLVATEGALPGFVVRLLLLANPADVYRLFNLAAVGGMELAEAVAGAGMHAGLGRADLVAAGIVWLGVAALLARASFARREL
ncbi:MAG: NosY permease [Rhodothalassiaceae bacterium]|nr:MAG: NosY permease [Rhodothalassiaceae bacterium]